MGENMERTFYIPVEKLIDKYTNITENVKRQRIQTICHGIVNESGNTVKVDFEFEANDTIHFTIQGEMERIAVAVGLLERHLKQERRQECRSLPQNVVALTIENLRNHNKNMMVKRQFACQPCQNVWWRKVMTYKSVSRCNRCRVRYDAVPNDFVFGWGRFTCHCGNVFSGRTQAGMASVCHRCRAMVLPEVDSIGPMNGNRLNERRNGNRHACHLCDNGRIQPCPGYNRVLFASQPHVSTGSTASTFLTQQSFAYRDPVN